MFTGLVTDVGTIRRREERGDIRIEVACTYDMETVPLGASIACSGACLTVVDKGPDWFAAEISSETERRTAAGLWDEGGRLNLERSLKLGEEIGGHIVTGHVDGIGTILSAERSGGSVEARIAAPAALAPCIAPKGSIALDGVSLTVNEVEDRGDAVEFTINVIPHTAEMTTLDTLEPGRELNVEIDVLARYLERMRKFNAS